MFSEVAEELPRRPEEDLDIQMQEVIYNSLDMVEERLTSMKASPMRDSDGFLGCLAVVGSLSLYGFVTNTQQKLIVALKSGNGPLEYKESSVRGLFRKLHLAVVAAFLNPFAQVDEPIKSKAFDTQIDVIARRFA